MDNSGLLLGILLGTPLSWEVIVLFIIITLLLALSALSSAAETAFFSLTYEQKEELKVDESASAQATARLLKKPDYLLATIAITDNLANISVVICSIVLFNSLAVFPISSLFGLCVQIVVISLAILLFGELIPKLYATQNAVKTVLRSARILLGLGKLFNPFATLLVKSTNILNKRLEKHKESNLLIDELSQALELTDDIKEDKEMLEGIVKFGNIPVSHVMTSRIDMVAVEVRFDYKQVIDCIKEAGYSRMPVYDDNYDNIVGVLYIKDLISFLEESATFRWQTLIRPATFVPQTRKIDDLLQDFQKQKVHIAIVVDEFGGTLGIVTMEDILEEIVGEISDEYDEEEPLYVQVEANVYEFEAKIVLKDFFKATNINPNIFEDYIDEAETLAGLLLAIEGTFPKEGDQIVYRDYCFIVLSVAHRRIERVRLEIN